MKIPKGWLAFKSCRSQRLSIFFALGLFFAVCNGQAQNFNSNWLTGSPADNFWAQMAQSPYAESGNKGLTVYMLTYSACPNCLIFLRDFWQARKSNIQLREIFAPINQPRFLNEAADLALTRDPNLADAYYHRARTAPPANSSPERQLALNRIENFVTQTNQFYRKIGHIPDGYPTFIFRARDDKGGPTRLWIISGWGPDIAADMEKWVAQGNP